MRDVGRDIYMALRDLSTFKRAWVWTLTAENMSDSGFTAAFKSLRVKLINAGKVNMFLMFYD